MYRIYYYFLCGIVKNFKLLLYQLFVFFSMSVKLNKFLVKETFAVTRNIPMLNKRALTDKDTHTHTNTDHTEDDHLFVSDCALSILSLSLPRPSITSLTFSSTSCGCLSRTPCAIVILCSIHGDDGFCVCQGTFSDLPKCLSRLSLFPFYLSRSLFLHLFSSSFWKCTSSIRNR